MALLPPRWDLSGDTIVIPKIPRGRDTKKVPAGALVVLPRIQECRRISRHHNFMFFLGFNYREINP